MLAMLLGFGLFGLLIPGLFGRDGDDEEDFPAQSGSDDAEVGAAISETESVIAWGDAPEGYAPDYAAVPEAYSFAEAAADLTWATGIEVTDRDSYEAALEVYRGPEADPVLGTPGDDTMYTGDGNDDVFGWEGDDRIFLQDGDDVYAARFVNEDAGDDFVRGGPGDDFLISRVGSDTLMGDTGDDVLNGRDEVGNRGADVLRGGWDNDTVFGDDGDTVSGGQGHDVLGVYLPERDVAEVTIEDFETNRDEIRIYVETDTPKMSEDYALTFEDRDGDTHIAVDGRAVAVVKGITGLDPALVRVGNYVTS